MPLPWMSEASRALRSDLDARLAQDEADLIKQLNRQLSDDRAAPGRPEAAERRAATEAPGPVPLPKLSAPVQVKSSRLSQPEQPLWDSRG